MTVEKHDVVWFGENDIRWFNTDYSSKMMSYVGRKLMGKGQLKSVPLVY